MSDKQKLDEAWRTYYQLLRSEAQRTVVPFGAHARQAQMLAAQGEALHAASLAERSEWQACRKAEDALIAFLRASQLCELLKEAPLTRAMGLIVEMGLEEGRHKAIARARSFCDLKEKGALRFAAAATQPLPPLPPPPLAAAPPAPAPTMPFPAAPAPLPLCRAAPRAGAACPNRVAREGAVFCDACNPWTAPPPPVRPVRPTLNPWAPAAVAGPQPSAPPLALPPAAGWGAPPAALAPAARLRPLRLPMDLVPAFLAASAANTALPGGGKETCGLLLGRFAPAAASGGGEEEGTVTHLLLPSQVGDGSNCEIDEAGELQVALATTGGLARCPPGLSVLGWIHTHPSQSAFLSAPDQHTHVTYQLLLREAVAVVVAPHDPAGGGRAVARVFRLTDAATREEVLATPQRLHWRPGSIAPALPFALARARFGDGVAVLQACRERGFHAHEAQDSITIYEDCEHAGAGGAGVTVVDVRGEAREAQEAAARRVSTGRGGGAGGGGHAEWACASCTLDNPAAASSCGACGAGRFARAGCAWLG
jgi:hypothetical protein